MTKVMIAEDDLLTADMLRDTLVENGYEVCGIASTVDKAVELGERHNPDLAILDIRLAEGGLGTEIPARIKNACPMGVLYASGHVGKLGLTKADGEALLTKPYRPEDVIRALKIVQQIVSTDGASRQFPKGFSVLDTSPKGATESDSYDTTANKENRRLRRQQMQLAKLGSFALGEHDLDNVLLQAARVCAQCLEVYHCAIYRYRSEENDLILEAGIGWDLGVIGRAVAQAENSSPPGRAFIGRRPVVCRDLTQDPTFVRSSFYSQHSIISTLDVVIGDSSSASRMPYGVLEISSTTQRGYDPQDTDFLTAIANIIAATVAAARRNTALRIALDHMQDLVDDKRRLSANNSLILDKKNQLLDRANNLLQDLRYRFRTHLQLVYGTLADLLCTTTDAGAAKSINVIIHRTMALAQIYEHLLDTDRSNTVDLGAYLSSLCPSIADADTNLHPGVRLTCQCDQVVLDLDAGTALGLIVTELISNSLEHAFPDGTGSISVSLTSGQSGDDATLIVSDNGVGVPENKDGNHPSLSLVKRLMEQVKGSVTICSDHGTKWVLKFPKPIDQPVGVSISHL